MLQKFFPTGYRSRKEYDLPRSCLSLAGLLAEFAAATLRRLRAMCGEAKFPQLLSIGWLQVVARVQVVRGYGNFRGCGAGQLKGCASVRIRLDCESLEVQ